jgi:hypothetical protein
MRFGTAIHKIAIRSRGVINDDEAGLGISEQHAKALLVGEYIVALQKDANAKF